MELHQRVENYYYDNFEKLGKYNFHFISRLYLWNREPRSTELLNEFKSKYNRENILKFLEEEIVEIKNDKAPLKNAGILREPYFQKYPELRTIIRILFTLMFSKTIYNNDLREILFEFYSKEYLNELTKQLMQDKYALAILSTHAINFLYIYNKFILGEDLDVESFYEVGLNQYNLDDKVNIQLLIYLYTHCIIGETNFYYKKIKDNNSPTYMKMIGYLEKLISNRYFEINLDNKFEFLVCCEILGYKTYLKDIINSEAAVSVSEEGTFIIDRYNLNRQEAFNGFKQSEHRNVLYIMENSNFNPIHK